jgi:hypothetical protein
MLTIYYIVQITRSIDTNNKVKEIFSIFECWIKFELVTSKIFDKSIQHGRSDMHMLPSLGLMQ